jgi:uncharacterized protein (DUF488 family)
MTRRTRVFTIGHSNHPIVAFLDLLQEHRVTAVADVRSAPYSRFAPQYTKEDFEKTLKAAGVKYVFLGRELGARPSDPACYEDGKVRYDRLAKTALFQAGVDRLVEGSYRETVAVLCTEKDPLDCHRTLLVAKELSKRGLAIDHILPDGSLETYYDSLMRLIDKTGQPPPDFFTTTEERIVTALRDQEARIAYLDKRLARSSADVQR